MADEKDRLIAELARARIGLSQSFGEVREDMDVPSKLRRSYRDNKWYWIGGAAAVGTALTALATRKKKVYVEKKSGKKDITEDTVRTAAEAGLSLVLLKFALSALRPAVTSFVTNKVVEWIEKRRE